MSRDPTEAVLTGLSRREAIRVPVAVVVAHPDDETIGLGPFLRLFHRLLLVHVTDGAPPNRLDARQAGFATCAAYAAARRQELRTALAAAGVRLQPACPAAVASAPSAPGLSGTARAMTLDVPDQGASLRLPWLAAVLKDRLAGTAVVLTHAYEGGHPDHDAVAFAVQATCLPRIELALYHAAPLGGLVAGHFLPIPDQTPPETVLCLSPCEQALRTRMLDSFVTQQATLAPFRNARALRLRPAPIYDFTRPPAALAYYDGFDWGITSARWRRLAANALRSA